MLFQSAHSFYRIADTKFLSNMGITKEEFHAMTWFSSWAVDGDHSCELPDVEEAEKHPAVR